jgi:hypothetical protein
MKRRMRAMLQSFDAYVKRPHNPIGERDWPVTGGDAIYNAMDKLHNPTLIHVVQNNNLAEMLF